MNLSNQGSNSLIWYSLEAFLLFIPLILGFLFFFRISARFRSRLIFPFDWSSGISLKKVLTPFRLQGGLRFLALTFLILALARPQKRLGKEKRIVESIDMIVAFDLSKSMEALDFSPNRRTVAIDRLVEFIYHRQDDRMGLVLFSGEAYLSVPLTLDHKLLLTNLKTSSNSALEDGTAIGQALAVAVNHLKNSTAKSKMILLVTDGDNNMGSIDPISASQIAAGFGIKIYSIGIGKKGRVPFPVTVEDGFGNKKQVLQYLTDAANDELLQKISTYTGGKAYSAIDQSLMGKILTEIDQLEKSKVEILNQSKTVEVADFFLWLGIFLLFAEGFALQSVWRKYP
ncbi:MAG: VWA domain-containing protein [bacterium]